MAKDLLYPGSLLGLHRKAADKLLSAGSGDAALLYLALLAGRDAAALGWDRARLDQAHALLLELGLADPQKPLAPKPPQKLEDSAPPTYTNQDVLDVMNRDVSFAQLVPEVEKRLGRSLITQDVKDLLYLTEYLGLPPEVVLLLVGHCADTRRGRVTLKQIKREGLRWYEAKALTVEEADAYIARQAKVRDRRRRLLALLDRPGRDPIKQEAQYLDAWIDQGFQDEVIREAYERTVFQVGELRWGYLNGILRSWHEQGLHTLEAVRGAEGQRRRQDRPAAGDRPAAPRAVDTGDIDWLLATQSGGKEG